MNILTHCDCLSANVGNSSGRGTNINGSGGEEAHTANPKENAYWKYIPYSNDNTTVKANKLEHRFRDHCVIRNEAQVTIQPYSFN